MPDTMLRILHVLVHLSLITTPRKKILSWHFTDEKIELMLISVSNLYQN